MSKRQITTAKNGAQRRRVGRDLCIWMVSPFGGVRKLRVGVVTIAFVGLFAIIGLSVVSYIAGDYVRMRIVGGQSKLFVRTLSVERDQLRNSNHSLKSKLNLLEGEQERSEDFEKEVRERLEELRAVIASVESLGAGSAVANKDIMGSPKVASRTDPKKGIGGAERECQPGEIKCAGLLLDEDEGEVLASKTAGSTQGMFSGFGDQLMTPLRHVMRMFAAQAVSPKEQLLAEMEQHIRTLQVLPLSPPGDAEISSEFGYRKSPFSGRKALHEGTDFSLQPGSPALVTGDGIVKEVRYHRTYGLVIDIEHTPRVVTRYAHLRKALVKKGEKVERGETIGLVGSTGRSTGPHLHYEVRIDGKPRNPEDLIALGQRLTDMF